MMRPRLPWLLALVLLSAALYPTLARRREAARVLRQLEVAVGDADGVVRRAATVAALSAEVSGVSSPSDTDPALMVRVEELGRVLASWQTIGGCGSSGATGSGIGIKWIGRNATGGLFNVQVQASYSQLSSPTLERSYFLNTLITRDVGTEWNVGVNVPYVYKYLDDPRQLSSPAAGIAGIDYSNSGLGDISLQGTAKLGRIHDTLLTLIVGVPTGTYQATYSGQPYKAGGGGGTPLGQQAQLGFGRVTATAVVDHTMDEVWGMVVVGGLAGYRGGMNKPLDNYRAPSATGYGYVGYFLGPFVPAFGLSLTGFTAHDKDLSQDENSALFVAAANLSLEWSTDWVALLAGASFPYQYTGISRDSNGAPISQWGWGSWLVALGVAFSPF
jgi:hypothetical protein